MKLITRKHTILSGIFWDSEDQELDGTPEEISKYLVAKVVKDQMDSLIENATK